MTSTCISTQVARPSTARRTVSRSSTSSVGSTTSTRPDNSEEGDRSMRKLLWPVLLVLVVAAVGAGIAVGGNGETNKKTFEYSIGLWGDLPYSDAQQAALPNLFADMNNAKLEFTV